MLGNDGDLFVGGNFATRVWNGQHFVYVYHVAKYDGKPLLCVILLACYDRFPMLTARTSSWLPIGGGGELKSKSLEATRSDQTAYKSYFHITL